MFYTWELCSCFIINIDKLFITGALKKKRD